MLFFRDPETGYFEDEESYYAYDREMEAREANRQARLDWEAEEMLAMAWAGDEGLTTQPPETTLGSAIDPETGCTSAEMKDDEMKQEETGGINPQQRRVA